MDRHHDPIRVTLLDTVTMQRVVRDDWTHWWWSEGNGSCDCNRSIAFDVEDPNEDENGCSFCMGCKRFLIVETSTNDIAEFNHGYPASLVRQHVTVPPHEFGETPDSEGNMLFTHAELAQAYARIRPTSQTPSAQP